MPIGFRKCKKHGITRHETIYKCVECAAENQGGAHSASHNIDYAAALREMELWINDENMSDIMKVEQVRTILQFRKSE